MALPRNIKSQVLEYLRLEYGESASNPNALKLSDLTYEGEHLEHGVPTHFWSYPTSSGKAYATVALTGREYRIATSDHGPPKRPQRRAKTAHRPR